MVAVVFIQNLLTYVCFGAYPLQLHEGVVKSKIEGIGSDLRHLKRFFENLFLQIVFLD